MKLAFVSMAVAALSSMQTAYRSCSIDIIMPIMKAITGSGILGKKAYFMAFPEEKTPEDDAEIEAEEDEAVKN